MQNNYENILSPDFNDPLQYFDSSPPVSRTTPPIYADDPWTTPPFDQDDLNSSYVIEQDHSMYFTTEQDNEQQKAIFGSELTPSNVLRKLFVISNSFQLS
jgi:hypothetical protein